MSIKWWETYIRTGLVIALICALVIGWAIPVTFTGLLSQINYLTQTYAWLAWLGMHNLRSSPIQNYSKGRIFQRCSTLT